MNLKDDKLNPTQLQQKITYLRAKLTKLETQIVDCENKYQSQLRLLKLENIKLIEEKEHIFLQLQITNEKYENMIENLRGQLPFYYDQENKLNYPLLNQNQKIEKLNQELSETQELNHVLNSKIKELQKESEIKASFIDSYNWFQEDMIHLKKNQDNIFTKMEKIHLDIRSFISKVSLLINEDHEFSILTQLEQQFKEILEDSFVCEEKLDSKYIIISEMETKLKKLSNEIEEVQHHINKDDS